MKPTLTVTKDFTKNFNAVIERFKYDRVLVGIPEEDTPRHDENGDEQINNATLLAIANFGSPAQNIPPWPIMALGIRNAKAEIWEQYKLSAQSALSKGLAALDTYYQRVGLIASTSIKKVINAQQDVPPDKPAEATLEARKLRKFKGTKYWLVTGQLRNAITYVIGGKR